MLDTHVLLWAAEQSKKLPKSAQTMLNDSRNELLFSAASIWEITIKRGIGRKDFQVEPSVLYRALIDNGYAELPITSEHTIAIDLLPPIHKDPFDRIIVAQAYTEGLTLLTADPIVAQYPGSIRKVRSPG